MPGPFDFPVAGRRRREEDAGLPVAPDAGAARKMPDVFNFPIAGKQAAVEKANDGKGASAPDRPPVAEDDVINQLRSFTAGATANLAAKAQGVGDWAYDLVRDEPVYENSLRGIGHAIDAADANYRDAAGRHPVANFAGKVALGTAGALIAGPSVPWQMGASALQAGVDEYAGSENAGTALISSGLAGATALPAHYLAQGIGKVGGQVASKAYDKVGSWFGKAPASELVDPAANRLLRNSDYTADTLEGGRLQTLPPPRQGRPAEAVHELEELPPAEVLTGARKFDIGEPAPAPSPLTRSGPPRSAEYEGADPLDELLAAREPTSAAVRPNPEQSMLARPPTVRAGGKFARANYPDADMSLPPETAQGPLQSVPDDLDVRAAGLSRSTFPGPADALEVPPAPAPEFGLGAASARRSSSGPVDALEAPPIMWDRQTVRPPPAATNVANPGSMERLARLAGHAVGSSGRGFRRAGQLVDYGLDVAIDALGKPANPYIAGAAKSTMMQTADALNPTSQGQDRKDGDEPVAYATPETTHYALSAVLSSGASGLPPADEQAMTSALVSGDSRQIRAADYRLRMQNPAYARAVERELRSYQEGD